MDPSILKSLQKIEELVKNKRNIIEQIPNKSNIDVAQIIPQMTLVSQNPASINTLNPLNNVMNLTNFHHDNNLFMNRVNPQTNISFNDGILLPNQLESNLNFFNENENKALNGKNSLLKTSKNQNDTNLKKKTQTEKDQTLKDKKKKVKTLRKIAGETWEDKTLDDWPENDFRIFCGDLGNEVNDEVLATAFRKYSSFQRARVIRDRRSGKTRGYGFVSMMDPQEYLKALSEMNGKYIGNRPIKIRKSTWTDRSLFGGKFNEGKGKKKIKFN